MASGNPTGAVRRTDDSIISFECDRGLHTRCPDQVPDGQAVDGGGPFDGYYCECPHHIGKPLLRIERDGIEQRSVIR